MRRRENPNDFNAGWSTSAACLYPAKTPQIERKEPGVMYQRGKKGFPAPKAIRTHAEQIYKT